MKKYEIILSAEVANEFMPEYETIVSVGELELTDEEVKTLIELYKEAESADLDDLDLEEDYPELYQKFLDAYEAIEPDAYNQQYLCYQTWAIDEIDTWGVDFSEAVATAKEKYGFKKGEEANDESEKEADDEEYNNGNDLYEELVEWAMNKLEELNTDEGIDFITDVFGIEVDETPTLEYTMELPKEIVDMADSKE